jgi:hypothetical protein
MERKKSQLHLNKFFVFYWLKLLLFLSFICRSFSVWIDQLCLVHFAGLWLCSFDPAGMGPIKRQEQSGSFMAETAEGEEKNRGKRAKQIP